MSGFGYNVLGFGANSSGGGEVLPSDDQFNRVSFLSHFDGANNGVNNVFDDGSANNYTVTAAGNVTQGSFGPFARPDGDWGVSFDGGSYVTSNYLQVAESSDFDFGTGDFTVEFFFFNREYGAYYDYLVTFGNNSSATTSFGIYIADGTNINLWNNGAIASSTSYNTNQWYHLAVVRASGTVKVYLDGSEIKSASLSSDISSPGGMNVANWRLIGDGQYFNGIISNLRVVKGTAVYTGNFTAPTSKLTAITNTKLLTCQSNRFVDNSATGHTVTPYVSPAVTAFGPFLTSSVYDAAVNGASAYMDGSGDTLRATWTAANIINQNFTLEYWLYYTQTSGYGTVSIGANDNTAGYTSLTYLASNGQVFSDDGQNSGSGPDAGAGAISPNSWNHLALVRVSNDMFIYINGAKIATKAITASLFQGQSGEFGIGYIANPLKGYICDARVVTSAVYTGDTYTVPTAPLTAVTNTKLLLNMADVQAIDSTAQNNLTLYGTAKTSTAQKKFGTASLLLDGNSDYASFPENGGNDIDNAGNWTVEFFWRFNNKTSPQYQMIMTKYNLQIYTDNGELRLAIGNGSGYFINNTGGTVLDNDTWYHIAVVKNGTSYNEYLNGTNEANLDGTSSSIIDSGGRPWYIGTLQTAEGTYPANGYMDEVRISKFARYTSNFTAPTEPFADKGQ